MAGGTITFCAVGWAGGDRVMFSQGSSLSWSGWDEGASENKKCFINIMMIFFQLTPTHSWRLGIQVVHNGDRPG